MPSSPPSFLVPPRPPPSCFLHSFLPSLLRTHAPFAPSFSYMFPSSVFAFSFSSFLPALCLFPLFPFFYSLSPFIFLPSLFPSLLGYIRLFSFVLFILPLLHSLSPFLSSFLSSHMLLLPLFIHLSLVLLSSLSFASIHLIHVLVLFSLFPSLLYTSLLSTFFYFSISQSSSYSTSPFAFFLFAYHSLRFINFSPFPSFLHTFFLATFPSALKRENYKRRIQVKTKAGKGNEEQQKGA